MRIKKYSYEKMKDFLGEWDEAVSDDTAQKKAAAVIQKALQTELTDCQRNCIELYFYKNMTLDQIAELLSVNKSTVSRHITRGKRRLERVIRYACFEDPRFHS